MKFKIPFIKPNFPHTQDITEDYQSIIAANWFTNFGPFEKRFSQATAEYVSDTCIATTISNCTLGLEAAVAALFDTKKPKVIMPSFTFVAGAEVLLRNGFQPLFIDINERTWQPNIDQARRLIEVRKDDIAGILLCNIFGVGNEEIAQWELLAKQHKLPLVIDSAAGFGSRYSVDEKVGGRGDCEVFSMHATKPFAIGEGGLVTSRHQSLIDTIRSWQNFGFESDRNIHRIGTNAKLQEINAAIGLRQLRDFEERLENRRETLRTYKQLLSTGAYLFQSNDELSTVPFVSVALDSASLAEKTYAALLENGIEVRRYYAPLHKQSILSQYKDKEISLSVTEAIASRIISLPVHDTMLSKDIEQITNIMLNISK